MVARFLALVLVAVIAAFSGLEPVAALTLVPPGNQNASQPPIPSGSRSRTKQTGGSFDSKYQKIRNMLANDKVLIGKIKKTAGRYGIDPIHIIGALVGEHTYNVDAMDSLQSYYVKAVAYLHDSSLVFEHDGEKVSQFVKRPQFAKCAELKDSYDLWSCREDVWKDVFRGKEVDGKTFPNDRFSRVFFQPLYAGQTFGLGQLNPLTALMASDMVHKVSGLPTLNPDKGAKVYATIMDPDKTLQYMAATLKIAIDAYRNIAGFDVSQNPGITATLYNLGDVRNRAYQLKQKNGGQLGGPAMPQENYYGWLVNANEAELRALLN